MDFLDTETQSPEDSLNWETDFDTPPPLAPQCKSFKWKINVIDTNGNIEGKMLTSKDVWKLQNSKVIVHFDEDSGQPIGDSAGLLGSWLERAWEVVQPKFRFDDPTVRKEYVTSTLGSRCKDVKRRLWGEYSKDTRSETVQNRPDNVPEDQWFHFVHMRFTEKWKRMQERNTINQKYNTMPHLCGRKSFPRRRNEIKIKTGKTPCRAAFFIETRTKPDGSFSCEEAKTRAEELTMVMSQNPRPTTNVSASLDDEYAQVFGPERHGRVRCVGRGPTPSKLVRRSTVTRTEIENSEIVVQLKTELDGLRNEVKGMTTFIQQLIGTSTVEQVIY
ncbi:unnamed protein product [Microthlaspi erraticum]|uniref:Uncharacterized protein n=1 Tax=Microthlaspi erraticum TaxID=1685480 RepID=A0A6D2L7M8_9BRAS|nr:unnamed protein product [Microthlaspi erraticum]